MKRLKYTAVLTAEHVEAMRLIYNDNLDMLSTKPIPRREYQEQQDWWNANSHLLKAFLYERMDNPGRFIAFLVLRNRDGFFTPIFAIDKSAWGNGFGREIIDDYISLAEGPLAGSQLKSNHSICHLNQKVGWIVLGSRKEDAGEVELLFHPGTHPSTLSEGVVQRIASYLDLPESAIRNKLTKGESCVN